MPRADFVMALILMTFSLLAIFESLELPRFEKDWGGFYAAPGFVPLILGLAIFAMSLALLIRAALQGGHKIVPAKKDLQRFVRAKPVHRWCLAMTYAFGFFFLLGRIDFYMAAFLVLFAFMVTYGEQKLITVIAVCLAASSLIYLVFTKIFLVPLP